MSGVLSRKCFSAADANPPAAGHARRHKRQTFDHIALVYCHKFLWLAIDLKFVRPKEAKISTRWIVARRPIRIKVVDHLLTFYFKVSARAIVVLFCLSQQNYSLCESKCRLYPVEKVWTPKLNSLFWKGFQQTPLTCILWCGSGEPLLRVYSFAVAIPILCERVGGCGCTTSWWGANVLQSDKLGEN